MLRLDEDSFEANTIIDLVVLPGMPISTIVSRLAESSRHLIILDTQGEMHFEHGKAPWTIGEEGCKESQLSQSTEVSLSPGSPVQRVDYCFTVSLSDLFSRLEDVKRHWGFVLVVDSVTFVCDRSLSSIRLFNTMLWSIIYRCNATVVTVNHYRLGKVKGVSKLVPRMGKFWSRCVSYQLLFTYNGDEIEFSVSTLRIEDF